MNILITGHRGLLGRSLTKALEGDNPFLYDVDQGFGSWIKNFRHNLTEQFPPLDVIVHAGAIMNNQSRDSELFLWNSAAVHTLAHEMATHPRLEHTYLIFISSRLAQWAYDAKYELPASPYAISKMVAEDYIRSLLPDSRYSILRPFNIWGDESDLPSSRPASVPYLLAAHQLKYLFRNLNRDYIHVTDVARAVERCIARRYNGTFDVGSGACVSAQELREAVEWKDYEIRDPEPGRLLPPEDTPASPDRFVPGWQPEIDVIAEMQRLEKCFQA